MLVKYATHSPVRSGRDGIPPSAPANRTTIAPIITKAGRRNRYIWLPFSGVGRGVGEAAARHPTSRARRPSTTGLLTPLALSDSLITYRLHRHDQDEA